jgi:hypothetical protein
MASKIPCHVLLASYSGSPVSGVNGLASEAIQIVECSVSKWNMERSDASRWDITRHSDAGEQFASKRVVKRSRIPLGTQASVVYGNAFRARRLELFLQLVDSVLKVKGVCNVLDVGGRAEDWMALKDVWGDRNMLFTIVNLRGSYAREGRFTWIIGDACNLECFEDDAFDVVYSNSVVEHVGDWGNKRRMANEVRRLAPQYFVQTPNFWFPFEPHLRLPLVHWLPPPLQRAAVKRRAWGFYRKAQDHHEAFEILNETVLLDTNDMIALFPESAIVKERFGLICKSLIAIRKSHA